MYTQKGCTTERTISCIWGIVARIGNKCTPGKGVHGKELFLIYGVSVTKGVHEKELFHIYGEIVTCIGNKCTPGKGVH